MKLQYTCLTALMVLASSCSTIKSAADFRSKVAKKIGMETGYITVWNTPTPLKLGNIYSLRPTTPTKKALFTQFDRFVDTTNTPEWREVEKERIASQNWSKTVKSSYNVKPQLQYMGLGAEASFANTKSVSFSARGHELQSIRNQDDYVEQVLNSAGTGPTFRKTVYEDTEQRKAAKLPVEASRYWIVTNLITVKDLEVKFSAKPSVSGAVTTPDANVLSQAVSTFLGVPGLTAKIGIGINNDVTKDSSVTSTEPFGLVGMCYPLVGSKNAQGDIVMTIDTDHPLPLANTTR